MRWILAAAVIGGAAPAAMAAEPQPVQAAASVTTYPASFFAPLGLDTAYDMVLRIPGFAFDDGSAVRGFAGAAGNVLIDGQRPASKTDDLTSILKRIPVSQVERIDLIRGATPGIDMQGKTVVANVVRKKGSGLTGAAQLGQYTVADAGYTDPQARIDLNWRGAARSFEGSLSSFKGHDDSHGSGRHEILAPDGEVLDVSDTRNANPNWAYKGVAAYEGPLAGGRIRTNVTLEDQPNELDSADLFRLAGRQAEHDRTDQRDGELGLRYSRNLVGALGLELFALQHLNRTSVTSAFVTASDEQLFTLRDKGGESIARAVLHWRPLAGLTVDGGGEFAYNWLQTRTRFSDNGLAIPLPAADVRVSEKRGEAFVDATWRPRSTVSLEGGVRVETSTITSTGDVELAKDLTFAKPRAVLTWSPDPRNQLRVRIEREVGQLDFNDFVASAALNTNGIAAGNPNIVPQQDWAYEVTYERHFWKDGDLSLTARRLSLKDVIDRIPVFAPSGVFDEPGNIGSGTETDLVASFNLPLARLGLKGAELRGIGTWRDSRVTDPTTGARRRISGQHPVDAELHFSQDLPRLKLYWGVDAYFAYREQFFRFDEIDTNRASTTVDVFADYKPRPDLVLRLLVMTRKTFDVRRGVFDGPRTMVPERFIDFQDRRFGPVVFTRVRKTFG